MSDKCNNKKEAGWCFLRITSLSRNSISYRMVGRVTNFVTCAGNACLIWNNKRSKTWTPRGIRSMWNINNWEKFVCLHRKTKWTNIEQIWSAQLISILLIVSKKTGFLRTGFMFAIKFSFSNTSLKMPMSILANVVGQFLNPSAAVFTFPSFCWEQTSFLLKLLIRFTPFQSAGFVTQSTPICIL